jgi:e3 binding domain
MTMAQRSTNRKRSKANPNRASSHNGRSASQKPEKYRFAHNVAGEGTVPEREYLEYSKDGAGMEQPDLVLNVPVLKVDSIHLELDDLEAHVALKAQVLDLLKLNVGIDLTLGKVRVDVKGVEAQALLKARLDYVAASIDRVLSALDRNPELLESVGSALEDVGWGTGHTMAETGEGFEHFSEGAGDALGHLGSGTGQAVGEIGQGAGQAVGDVGEGAGQAVGDVGEGAGQAVGDVGEGAGQAVGDVGEGAGEAVGNLDQTLAGLGEMVGQTVGGARGAAGGVGPQQSGDGEPAVDPATIAKEAARTTALQLGVTASEGAKITAKALGAATQRKAQELKERRRQRKAEKQHATKAAIRMADELDIDLDELDGTGADGRITVHDVRAARNASD